MPGRQEDRRPLRRLTPDARCWSTGQVVTARDENESAFVSGPSSSVGAAGPAFLAPVFLDPVDPVARQSPEEDEPLDVQFLEDGANRPPIQRRPFGGDGCDDGL